MVLCYTLERAAAPLTEPLALDEAKRYLRVDTADDDELITTLIAAIRDAAERYLRRSLITQGWIMGFDAYAPSPLELPRGPLQGVNGVKTIARTGEEVVIDPDSYVLAGDRLTFDTTPMGDRVEINYTAGFGDAASDLPPAIRQGLFAHLAAVYDHRHAPDIPAQAHTFYHSYRTMEL